MSTALDENEQNKADAPAEMVFLIDKPKGMSSFAVVRQVRRLLGIKKVGHAGTLDPFATGLLIICAGRPATRHIARFMESRKSYLACLQLGVETDTQDPEGQVTAVTKVPALDAALIDACLRRYLGPQMQSPPAYSAAKHKGKPLYAYARQGIVVTKEAKAIEIYALRSRGYDQQQQTLDIELSCSRGTYVRVLASEIGRDLGCGAHLVDLRRTSSGSFSVDEAISGEALFTDKGKELLLASRQNIDAMLGRLQTTALSTCQPAPA